MNLSDQYRVFQSWPQKLKEVGLNVDSLSEHCFSIQNSNLKKTVKEYDVFLSALIHGNELGGLGVINSFLEKIFNTPKSLSTKILVHLGNIEAAKQNVRFLQRDLNRSFLNPNPVDSSSKLEERLAKNIESLVLKCSYSIDLHQTNSPSKTPFFIFTYSEGSLKWAKYLNSKIPAITSKIERHKDGSTLDFFCLKNSIPSCTLELGQAGFDLAQIEFGSNLLEKILNLPNSFLNPTFENMYKVLETLYWSDRRIYLKPGFENFSIIKIDATLASYDIEQGPEILKAPFDCALLFPKYGNIADQTKEVVTFAIPINSVNDI